MTEDEWDATDQGKATDSFIATTLALSVVYAAAELGSKITNQLGPFAQWAISNGPKIGAPSDIVNHLKAEQKYLDMLDPELDQAVRSSAIIIGGCSAIEAYVERFCKNRMREDPSILDGTNFDAKRIAQKKKLALTDQSQIFEEQWRAISRSPGAEPRLHKRFEITLGAVGRNGATPPVIETDVDTAYVIRNVWGHNAGYADDSFLAKAPPNLICPKGDLVNLSQDDGKRYLSVIMTYGMIVANRERALFGLGPIPMKGDSAQAAWGQAYRTLYGI
jgi:hypothetical protein